LLLASEVTVVVAVLGRRRRRPSGVRVGVESRRPRDAPESAQHGQCHVVLDSDRYRRLHRSLCLTRQRRARTRLPRCAGFGSVRLPRPARTEPLGRPPLAAESRTRPLKVPVSVLALTRSAWSCWDTVRALGASVSRAMYTSSYPPALRPVVAVTTIGTDTGSSFVRMMRTKSAPPGWGVARSLRRNVLGRRTSCDRAV